MPDRNPDAPHQRRRLLRDKHAESQTILGIAMAGVAALFIIGIVAAFQYAASTADSPAEIHAQSPSDRPGSRLQ